MAGSRPFRRRSCSLSQKDRSAPGDFCSRFLDSPAAASRSTPAPSGYKDQPRKSSTAAFRRNQLTFDGRDGRADCADPRGGLANASLNCRFHARPLVPIPSLARRTSDGSDIMTNGRFDASKEFLMKAMDWKRGVGVACLLVTVAASPARAQTGAIKEPAGIPVVREGMKVMGSPFSPQYQGAWYQSQANRVAMMAWAERYEAEREVYLAEMAVKKAEAAKIKAEGGKNGDVLWTKVHKPWYLGPNAKISDKPVAMPT